MKQLITITLCFIVLFSFLITKKAVSQLADSPWPMYGHDERHTFSSPYKGPDSVRVAWIFESEDDIRSAPVIDQDGTIYLCTNYHLNALDRSGGLKWSYEFDGGSYYDWNPNPALSSDGTIYFVGDQQWKSYLFALSNTGNKKWRYQLEGTSESTPTIGPDGTIYIGHSKGLSVIRSDGTLKWEYMMGEYGTDSSPAIGSDSTVYIGSNSIGPNIHPFYALNYDGSLKWEYVFPYSDVFAPCIDPSGTIYTGTYVEFYALNKDGSVKWLYPRGIYGVAIGNNGTIYGKNVISTAQGTTIICLAFNSESGSIKWQYQLPGRNYKSSLIVDSEGAIYNASDSTLIALNPDGTLKWSYEDLPGKAISEHSITLGSNKDIYLVIDENKLCALFEQPIDWPPMMPRNLRAVPGHTQVSLMWSPNFESDIAYYAIYRNQNNGFEPSPNDSIAQVSAPDTTYSDMGLINGTTYYYRICAVDSAFQRSDYTSQVSATPVFNPDFLILISPSKDTIVTSSPILIKGRAVTPYVAKVEVNDSEVPIINNSFETQIALNEGRNRVTVIGYESNDTVAKEIIIWITLDSKIPDIRISSPTDGRSLSYSPVQVQGTVTDENLVSVYVNEIKVPISNNTFTLGDNSGEGLEIEEGWFWIKATAVDSAGNVGSDSVKINGVPPSPKKLYLKDDILSWFPYPPYPSGISGYAMVFILDSQGHSWTFPVEGDIEGSDYTFNFLKGCYGLGSAEMKVKLILRKDGNDIQLASTSEFTGDMAGWTPFGYQHPSRFDTTIIGLDPYTSLGDTLIFNIYKVGGDRAGLIFIRESDMGNSWLQIPDMEVSVEKEPITILPLDFKLYQNYPNPFNPETTIHYQLPKQSHVRVEIYNILGEKIVTLVGKNQPAGYYSVHWDGKNERGNAISSGVYLCTLKAGEFVQVRKMALVR